MILLRFFYLSALLLSCCKPCSASAGPSFGQRGVESTAAATPREELQTRDLRLSFSRGSAERARAALRALDGVDVAEWDLKHVASALMGLGCGGVNEDLVTLERFAEAGKLSLRRAAFFGIGEMGIRGFPVLERLMRGHLVGAEESALLALIRIDQQSSVEPRVALQFALDACGDLRPGISETALFLRDYALGGPAPAALPALDAYYELRWSAACDFGFVDGLRWKDLLLQELLGEPRYLNRFVFGQSQGLERGLVRSHVIELFSAKHPAGCAAGVNENFPGVIALLYGDSGWRPSSIEEWDELLFSIQQLDDRESFHPILQGALGALPNLPGFALLRNRAALMLLADNQEVSKTWINAALRSSDPFLQARLLEIGAASGGEFIRLYAQRVLQESNSPTLVVKAQVALARMGDKQIGEDLSNAIRAARPSMRLIALEAMARVSSDPRIRAWLRSLVDGIELSRDAQHSVALSLAWSSPAGVDRERLRAALRSQVGSSRDRVRGLNWLTKNPDAEDLALFKELFPVDGDLEFNLLLARALSSKHNAHTLEVLRRVLWGEQWNLSVLAGGVCVEMFGARFLLEELATPPAAATDRQRRCVGFALGEWGGLTAVEDLARTHAAVDPALQGAYLGAMSSSQE